MVGQTCSVDLLSTSCRPRADRSQAPRQALLSPSWAILGPLGANLAPSWAILGSRWPPTAKISIFPKVFNDFRANPDPILGPLGAILGAILRPLRASWGILGPSDASLGPSWGHFGAIEAESCQSALTSQQKEASWPSKGGGPTTFAECAWPLPGLLAFFL